MLRKSIAAFAVVIGAAISSEIGAQVPAAGVIVLESNVAGIEAPQVFLGPGSYGKDRVLQIPEGRNIKVMLPSGKTVVLSGPRSPRVGDLIDAIDEAPAFTEMSERIMSGNLSKALKSMGVK